MKVKSIRATPVNIPFVAPYRFSYGAIASLTKTIVELETEEGVIGLGECADGDRSADVGTLAERLIGLDIRLVAEAERRVVPGMAYTPWDNLLAKRRAFGGIEMAMSAAVRHLSDASQTLLRWYADDVIEGGPMQPKSGRLAVPDGPGLGVALDRATLSRCHARYVEEGAFPGATGSTGYGGSFMKR